ncbi:MAG: TVP38/TMEM64 family protein [Planctomycetes bacterium]|nr:TVP38/TMEM64 family protein [Planctomycetota bacterium]
MQGSPGPITEAPAASRPPPGVYGAGALLAIWSVVPFFMGAYLLSQIATLTEWFRADGLRGPVVFAMGYALCCGAGLLPTYAPSIAAGWIFGPFVGFPVCVAGYLGGSTLGFGLSRLAARGGQLAAWIDHWPRAAVIRRALVEERASRTALLVGLLRLSPSCPFSATNLAMAGAGVRYPLFMVGTVLGMAPRTLAAVIISHMAAQQGAKDLLQLATQQGVVAVAIGVALLVGSLALIGHISRMALDRALAAGPSSPQ